MMKEYAIEISNLSKSYGEKVAINNIDLKIKVGMFGLLGPNGAGKTTLMKMLATILLPTSGKIEIDGKQIKCNEETRAKIGYLPQEFEMYKNMTAYEILDYLAILSGISGKERKKLVNETLKKVNLYKEKKIKFGSMSGGMKRRIGIAQAIIHNPKVIIVDEPTAGLDPEERIRFRNMLCEIAKDRVVILSTHIVADVEATCKNIAILIEGNIVFNGTMEELIRNVEGKVYSVFVPIEKLEDIKNNYIVSGVKMAAGMAEVKFISDANPIPNAKQVQEDIEDAYLFLVNKSKRGEIVC